MIRISFSDMYVIIEGERTYVCSERGEKGGACTGLCCREQVLWCEVGLLRVLM